MQFWIVLLSPWAENSSTFYRIFSPLITPFSLPTDLSYCAPPSLDRGHDMQIKTSGLKSIITPSLPYKVCIFKGVLQ